MKTLAQQYFETECNHSIRQSDYKLAINPDVEIEIDTLHHYTVCKFNDDSAIIINLDCTELKVVSEWNHKGYVILERVA